MTENEYLEMPWSIEDTIENLKEVKEFMQLRCKKMNLDGKGETDAKEVEFDFDRAIKALEKQIPKKIAKYDVCPVCNNNQSTTWYYAGSSYCEFCGQKLDWSNEE